MARKGDVHVATVKAAHDKISISIYYNDYRQEFRATYAGVAYVGTSRADVEKQVVAAAEAALSIIWTPIIEVKLNPVPHTLGEVKVELCVDRYWVTRLGGKLLKAEWASKYTSKEDSDELRLERSKPLSWDNAGTKFEPPVIIDHKYQSWGYRWEAYLVFTDRLWANLIALQTSLRNVHQNLSELIGTDAGHAALLTGQILPYQAALPAPAKETDSHVD